VYSNALRAPDTGVRDAGTLDRTLVIVTSDHGESLGDHGEDWHGYFIYESTLRVPLIVRGPGVKPGTQVGVVARSVDLFPTMAEMAGLSAGAPVTSGRSLAPALRGAAMSDNAPSFAESLVPLVHFGWSDLRSMRDGRWKYIQAPRPELYDLEGDPGELRNLAASDAARAAAMRATLDARLRTEQAASGTATGAGIPPALLEKLGALGYVSHGGPPAGKATGADPKDKLEEYKTVTRSMAQGLLALNGGRPGEAAELFRGLTQRGVDTFDVHCYLARAYTALNRHRDAAAEYERAVAQLPSYDAAWRGLGESRAAIGDRAGASKAFEHLVSLVPGDALAKMQLAETYGDLKRIPEALRLMREAVSIDPNPAYWNALGTLLGGTGQMPDAEHAFKESVARDPNNTLYLYNHGIALQRLGRREEAIGEFRRAAVLGSAQARTKLAELGVREP
jgi:tetratricopeptide (TPR) repeat protein